MRNSFDDLPDYEVGGSGVAVGVPWVSGTAGGEIGCSGVPGVSGVVAGASGTTGVWGGVIGVASVAGGAPAGNCSPIDCCGAIGVLPGGGFGNLKTKVAYKRYAAYIERLLSRKPKGKL